MREKIKFQIHLPAELQGIEISVQLFQAGEEIAKIGEILPPRYHEVKIPSIKIVCKGTVNGSELYKETDIVPDIQD